MVLVPAGEFMMGTEDEDLPDAPLHKVELDAYYIDKYEVTNELFVKFLNSARPPEGVNELRWNWVVIRTDLFTEERDGWWPTEIVYEDGRYKSFPGYQRLPVNSVNWNAAREYCEWAGKRLPTEAEWEKAARGGLEKKRYPWGNEIPTGGVIFNRKWAHFEDPPPTSPVGNYHPNGYGIFDMAGNVWEWCADWYHPAYYKESPKKNPKGPESGTQKVMRGGSWFNTADVLRAALRNWSVPEALEDSVGFRCASDPGVIK